MSRQSIESLIEQLCDRKGTVREKAREELVLRGSSAVPALLELVKSRDKRARWEAAKSLSEIGEPSSIPALVQLLSDPESGIRWLGAVGLIAVGPLSIPAVLQELINKPASIHVRRGAHHVFNDLGQGSTALRQILAPVMDVLGDVDSDSAIPPRAEEAQWRFLSSQEWWAQEAAKDRPAAASPVSEAGSNQAGPTPEADDQ